ncbi:MAG: hypothetical protein AB7P31_14005 [Steroidobacteraceae bacterium]
MGLSETIVAAIIGASATVSAAGFNFARARTPPGAKPRRSAWRAALSLAGLVVASAAGGFIYSEFRAQGAREEIARLRVTMNEQLQVLARAPPQVHSSEALVELAPCVRNGSEGDGPAPICAAALTTPTTLCTQLPAAAERLGVEFYSRPLGESGAWTAHPDTGDPGALDVSFAAVAPSPAVGTEGGAVCAHVLSEDPARVQVARLVVRYRAPPAAVPATVAAR